MSSFERMWWGKINETKNIFSCSVMGRWRNVSVLYWVGGGEWKRSLRFQGNSLYNCLYFHPNAHQNTKKSEHTSQKALFFGSDCLPETSRRVCVQTLWPWQDWAECRHLSLHQLTSRLFFLFSGIPLFLSRSQGIEEGMDTPGKLESHSGRRSWVQELWSKIKLANHRIYMSRGDL